MFMTSRGILAVLLTVSLPLALQAQTTTHTLHVNLENDCERAEETLYVVIGDQDRSTVGVSRDKTNRCLWTGRKQGPPFSLGKTFSIRMKGARTDCRRASERRPIPPEREPIAELVFRYKPNSAREVLIDVDPQTFQVEYERALTSAESNRQQNYDCRETGTLPGSGDKVKAVRYPPFETVRLRFASVAGQPDSPWITLDQALQDEMARNRKNRRPTVLGPNAVGVVFQRQKVIDPKDALPFMSVPTAALVAERLTEKKMKNVTLAEE